MTAQQTALAEVCEEWAQKDARIKVIHKVNSGQADSRNQALEICQGAYIGFVDSDDWIEESMYEVLMNDLKTTNSDIAICNHYDQKVRTRLFAKMLQIEIYLKEPRIQELVIKDKIKSYISANALQTRVASTSQCLTSRITKTMAILPYWFEMPNRWSVLTSRCIIPTGFEKAASSTIYLSDRYYELLFQAEISRYNYYKRYSFPQDCQKNGRKSEVSKRLKTYQEKPNFSIEAERNQGHGTTGYPMTSRPFL